MAYQLGALGAIKTPELVKMSKPTSGNYSQLFGQMNRNQQALGQREDRATLNALGSARAEAIMDGQAGSAKLQAIKEAQAKALNVDKDIPLYDKLTGDLKAQMQIESAEAKADPFGKNQLNRDKLAQSQKSKSLLSDPRVVELRKVQDSTKLEAQNLLSQAIATTDGKIRETLRGEYDKLLAQNWEADRQLTSFGLAEHHKNPMNPWVKALGGMAKQAGAESIANAMVRKIMAEAGVSEEKAKDIVAKIEREKAADDRSKQAHGQRMAIGEESLLQAKEKTKDATSGSQYQIDNAGFVKRMIDADAILSQIQPSVMQGYIAKFGSATGLFDDAFNVNASEFITPNLRDESGAAIGKDEFENAESRLIPKPQDSPQTLAFKARNRANIINKGIQASGKVWTGGDYSSTFTGNVSSDIDDAKTQPKTVNTTKKRNKIFNPSTNTFE